MSIVAVAQRLSSRKRRCGATRNSAPSAVRPTSIGNSMSPRSVSDTRTRRETPPSESVVSITGRRSARPLESRIDLYSAISTRAERVRPRAPAGISTSTSGRPAALVPAGRIDRTCSAQVRAPVSIFARRRSTPSSGRATRSHQPTSITRGGETDACAECDDDDDDERRAAQLADAHQAAAGEPAGARVEDHAGGGRAQRLARGDARLAEPRGHFAEADDGAGRDRRLGHAGTRRLDGG